MLKKKDLSKLELINHYHGKRRVGSDMKWSKIIKIQILATGRVLHSWEDKAQPERARESQRAVRKLGE